MLGLQGQGMTLVIRLVGDGVLGRTEFRFEVRRVRFYGVRSCRHPQNTVNQSQISSCPGRTISPS